MNVFPAVLRRLLPVCLASLALLAGAPLQAQQGSIGVGADFMGYSFDDGLGADAVQLFLTPVAVRLPLSTDVTVDLYGAWARGEVERNGVTYSLSGPVDTRVKASYQATPWALLSFGASLPTGHSAHDGDEAVVASVLSTDLLGFREATWGTGATLTSSVATAVQAGPFGLGIAGSYSVRGEFEPSADQGLVYQPGNETRLRIGIDRNIGTNTLTGGVTFSRYSEDRYFQDRTAGRNLFQAGNRIRGDLGYAFRAGAGIWNVYVADIWRENGDLTLAVEDGGGAPTGDSTFATATQNLVVTGVRGTVGLGGGFVFRPDVDLRLQQREEPDGRTEGSGWILGAGGDLPLRLFGAYDIFPRARFLYGSITDPTGVGRAVMGAELSATLRWSF